MLGTIIVLLSAMAEVCYVPGRVGWRKC